MKSPSNRLKKYPIAMADCRARMCVNREEFARRLGISRVTLHKYEVSPGDMPVRVLMILENLMDAHGVTYVE